MSLWKKQESVEKMLGRYFEQADTCYSRLKEALEHYFEHGLGDDFRTAVVRTHQAESKCDDLRREIELTLYGKALLPESRGDILGLLETYDGLPNVAETIVFVIDSQQLEVPEQFADQLRRLVAVNIEAYGLARKAVDALMTNPKVTLHTTKAVDLKESESDAIERELLYDLFKSDIKATMKLQLKELVLIIGDISDRAEKVADRIGIVAIKRQI